jgi:hypothetical protein
MGGTTSSCTSTQQSFLLLASVELQSVMHFLDLFAILRLACCSRFTLQCANSEFALKHVDPVHVTPVGPAASLMWNSSCPREMQTRIPDASLRGLFQHARFHVSFRPEADGITQLISLHAPIRIVSVDLGWQQYNLQSLRKLLLHPYTKQLTCLKVDRLTAVECQLLLELKPELQSLTLYFKDLHEAPFALLGHFSQLTELCILDRTNLLSGISLSECRALKKLHLRHNHASNYPTIFSNPSLENLIELSVESSTNAFNAPDWSIVFARVKRLQRLTVIRMDGLDQLLTALVQHGSRCIAVIRLILRPALVICLPEPINRSCACHPPDNMRGGTYFPPSSTALHSVLIAFRSVFVHITRLNRAGGGVEPNRRLLTTLWNSENRWKKSYADLCAIAKMYPGRLSVEA